MKPLNAKLANQLRPYLELAGNDACNTESDDLWSVFNSIQVTMDYLGGKPIQSPVIAPWKSIE